MGESRKRSKRKSKNRVLHSSWRARVPTHWGRKTWDALFLLAADYPHVQECKDDDPFPQRVILERRRAWRKMLLSLPGILSCGVCSDHFQRYMERDGGRPMERALQDRESLLEWLYKAKDEVNERNGTKRPRFEDIRRKYVPKCTNHV